jgi:hypothetical protein
VNLFEDRGIDGKAVAVLEAGTSACIETLVVTLIWQLRVNVFTARMMISIAPDDTDCVFLLSVCIF